MSTQCCEQIWEAINQRFGLEQDAEHKRFITNLLIITGLVKDDKSGWIPFINHQIKNRTLPEPVIEKYMLLRNEWDALSVQDKTEWSGKLNATMSDWNLFVKIHNQSLATQFPSGPDRMKEIKNMWCRMTKNEKKKWFDAQFQQTTSPPVSISEHTSSSTLAPVQESTSMSLDKTDDNTNASPQNDSEQSGGKKRIVRRK